VKNAIFPPASFFSMKLIQWLKNRVQLSSLAGQPTQIQKVIKEQYNNNIEERHSIEQITQPSRWALQNYL